MKDLLFQEAMNEIDNDLIEAADTNVSPMSKKKKGFVYAAGIAAACIAAVGLFIFLPKLSGITPKKEQGAEAGGLRGKINISVPCKITGKEYEVTNEEGSAFLEEMRTSIRNELSGSGVKVEAMKIMKTGFSHLRTGDGGNSMAVDWRDFLIYSGEEIIATASVMKDGQGLHYYLAFGSPCYADYAAFLQKHRGEELVYIWAGDVDAILTADHGIYTFGAGIDEAIVEAEKDRYYDFFKKPENTYVPE